MPYIKPVDIDTLTLPSDPAYWVKLRQRIRYGAVNKAQSAMLRVDMGSPELSEVELASYTNTLIAGSIVEWNLTDENEQVLPITPESIDQLEPEDGQFLAQEVQKRARLRRPAEQRNFPSPS